MRCLNCQTVLMAGDKRCPMCGMHTDPNEGSSLEARAEYDPAARRQLVMMRLGFGFIGTPLGLILLILGGQGLYQTYAEPPKPRDLTAAELLKIEKPADMPGWIAYLPPKEAATGVGYRKLRSGTVTSEFILLQVGNRWMLAQVRPDAVGFRVVGKLVEPDHLAVGMLPPNEGSRLLPVMIDAETPPNIAQRQDYITSGISVGAGALLIFLGGSFLMTKVPMPKGQQRESAGIPRSALGSVPLASAGQAPTWIGPELQPASSGGGCLKRILFSGLWGFALFLGAMAIAGIYAGVSTGGDPEKSKELAEQAGQLAGPWIMLGCLGVFFVGLLGKLPGTR